MTGNLNINLVDLDDTIPKHSYDNFDVFSHKT